MKDNWLKYEMAGAYGTNVALVLMIAAVYGGRKMEMLISLTMFLYALAMAVVISCSLAGIFYAIRHKQEICGEEKLYAKIFSWKKKMLPFYLINIAIWSFFVLQVGHPNLGGLWMLIPTGVCYTYLSVIGTSIYSILRLMEERGKNYIVHTLMHMLFVLDFLSAFLLYKKGNVSTF